jgi:hypothetical protein
MERTYALVLLGAIAKSLTGGADLTRSAGNSIDGERFKGDELCAVCSFGMKQALTGPV